MGKKTRFLFGASIDLGQYDTELMNRKDWNRL